MGTGQSLWQDVWHFACGLGLLCTHEPAQGRGRGIPVAARIMLVSWIPQGHRLTHLF